MIKIIILSVLAVLSVSAQDFPIAGGFTNINPNDEEVKEIASAILNQLFPYYRTQDACRLILEDVVEAKSQAVAGTNYHFTLKIATFGDFCDMEVKTCSNVRVNKPFACGGPINSCLKVVETSKISCVPDIVVDPIIAVDPPVPGGFSKIENPQADLKIRALGKSATNFLYHLFDTSVPCPIFLREVIAAESQTVALGNNYKFDMDVETDSANFECKYVFKRCSNIQIHDPLGNCPNGETECLVPINLKDFECIEINTEASSGGQTAQTQISLNDSMEEILKRIHDIKNVAGVIVVNSEGIPIKTTLDNSMTVQYSGLLSQFAERSKCVVRDLDPTNELTYLRIKSKRYEILVAPDNDYILIALQNPPEPINN